SFNATGLPSGLSIDSTGKISGTISNSAHASSPYQVTVTATDGTDSASVTFNWSVTRLAVDNPGNQQYREGASVSLTLTVTDHVGTPTFSATGLPSGVSIDSSGHITGTLASNSHLQSPYQVTVTAT